MYVRVRVSPGAKKEIFEREGESRFRVAVKEKAERNLANARVLELVAEHFNVPFTSVRIISGHATPAKLISIRD